MSRIVVLLLSLLVTAFVVAGCGGEPATEGTPEETTAGTPDTTDTPEVPQLSETITLPSGWEINDALTPAEVEAILGRTGYQPWSEPLSDAAAGKPQGSFYDDSLAASCVNFLVYCTEGQSNYDRVSAFIENPVEVQNELWDQAIIGDMPDMAGDYVAILLRRGDQCIRVRYHPEMYPGLDRDETLTELAELLINRIYAQ